MNTIQICGCIDSHGAVEAVDVSQITPQFYTLYLGEPGSYRAFADLPELEVARDVARLLARAKGYAIDDRTKIDPVFAPGHIHTASMIGAYLMMSLMEHEQYDCFSQDYVNGGHVGLVSDVMHYVPELLEGFNREDEHPGVYMYEVVTLVGEAVAEHLDEHRSNPIGVSFEILIAETIDKFYAQS